MQSLLRRREESSYLKETMKTLLSPFSCLALLFATSAAYSQSAENLTHSQAYYAKGLEFEKAGQPAKALQYYQAALKLNPQNPEARFRAGQMKLHSGVIEKKSREATIGAVVIPQFQLEEASVAEAIQALSIAIEKATDGEIAPNFIIEDPDGRLADRTISLQLKNIPVKAILEYINNSAKTIARFDPHAIVITAR